MSEEKKALVGNAADEEQVKEAKKKEKRGRERDLEDLGVVLSGPAGRRFVWRYLGACGVFKTSMTGDSYTYFNEGRRDVGLQLLADVMEADPNAYLLMTKEAKQDG